MLLNKTTYGIDEGAAQALLLAWSVADNVVSSIVTLGLSDFRAVFLAPVGFLWTGNVLAAKISTIMVMAVRRGHFHAWRRRSGDSEGALLATGLLLVSPLVLNQIVHISVAPYLFFTFAFGAWADQKYRESPQAFGAMYFAQMLLCMVSATLHPAGLAYPLLCCGHGIETHLTESSKVILSAGSSLLLYWLCVLTLGWSHVEWFTNPSRACQVCSWDRLTRESLGAFRWITE